MLPEKWFSPRLLPGVLISYDLVTAHFVVHFRLDGATQKVWSTMGGNSNDLARLGFDTSPPRGQPRTPPRIIWVSKEVGIAHGDRKGYGDTWTGTDAKAVLFRVHFRRSGGFGGASHRLTGA